METCTFHPQLDPISECLASKRIKETVQRLYDDELE